MINNRVEILKGMDLENLNDKLGKAIKIYCSEKSDTITLEKASSLNNELTKIAITYVAYKIKKSGFNGNYSEFMSKVEVSNKVREILEYHVEGFWNLVQEISEEFSLDELISYTIFYDSEGRSHFERVTDGIISTPESLIKLSNKLLDVKSGDNVLDLCSGKGNFLRDTYCSHPDAKYYGVEINYVQAGISLIRMEALESDSDIYLEDANEFRGDTKYDKVFSNCPFRMKLSNVDTVANRYSEEIGITEIELLRASSDWIFNLSLLDNLKESGKGVAISVMGTLWRPNSPDKKIRKYFVDNGYIETIINLPASMFNGTGVSTCIIVFSRNNEKVRLIDASDLGEVKDRIKKVLTEDDISNIISMVENDTKKSKLVDFNEIKNNDYILDPIKYLDSIPEFENGIKLGDLSLGISRGDQSSHKDINELRTTEKTKYRCLELSDIKDGYVDFKDEYLETIQEEKQKYLAKDKMIVITRVGNPSFRSVIIDKKDEEEILVTGQFILVELDDKKINPAYVQAFLTSDLGKKCLNRASTGNVLKNISIGELKKMVIPVPSREIQDEIANEYLATVDEVILWQKKYNDAKEKLHYVYKEEGLV